MTTACQGYGVQAIRNFKWARGDVNPAEMVGRGPGGETGLGASGRAAEGLGWRGGREGDRVARRSGGDRVARW